MEGAKKKKKKGEPETDANSVVNNEVSNRGPLGVAFVLW